jgi:hypothetical protein|nr:MAG TPA: NADH-PPase NADH pyrophosphatase zinc ribbon domain [Caudoviricetes sp.]
MIKTIRELKKAIANIDDDFTIDVRIVRELSEEELSGSNYPYPYEYTKANLEIGDIGYSDKDVFINVWNDAIEIAQAGCVSDDCCEWEPHRNNYVTSCEEDFVPMMRGYKYCPYCGKKIKIVGD